MRARVVISGMTHSYIFIVHNLCFPQQVLDRALCHARARGVYTTHAHCDLAVNIIFLLSNIYVNTQQVNNINLKLWQCKQ